jgi:hemoglobin
MASPSGAAASTVVSVPPTVYEQVGGDGFFDALVDRFYEGVASDPVLRSLYPEDLTEPREHLRLFLVQYWGGPRTYDDLRGHPRLRMRHAPFAIGLAERDAWLRHMLAALRSASPPADVEGEMAEYFQSAATQLINRV